MRGRLLVFWPCWLHDLGHLSIPIRKNLLLKVPSSGDFAAEPPIRLMRSIQSWEDRKVDFDPSVSQRQANCCSKELLYGEDHCRIPWHHLLHDNLLVLVRRSNASLFSAPSAPDTFCSNSECSGGTFLSVVKNLQFQCKEHTLIPSQN